jgi:hypothetical protein
VTINLAKGDTADDAGRHRRRYLDLRAQSTGRFSLLVRVSEGNGGRKLLLLVSAIAALVIASAAAILFREDARFAVLAPSAEANEANMEGASALASLFRTLVLFLCLAHKVSYRPRWVAGELAILRLGGLVFGYLPPLLADPPTLNMSIYAWLVIQSVACLLLAAGLVLILCILPTGIPAGLASRREGQP